MTTTVPSISPRQDLPCQICGRASANDPHHVLHRSAGGTDHEHNLLYLCRECHQRCHGDVGRPAWVVAQTEHFLYVSEEGRIIVQRPIGYPEGWDEGVFVAQLEQSPRDLQRMSAGFRFLSDEGILATAEALYGLGETAWHCRARLFQVARLRMPYGKTTDALEALGRQFELSTRQVWRDIEAMEAADAAGCDIMSQLPPQEVLRVIGKAPDPKAALELWEDRVRTGSYTAPQLREEIRRGNSDSAAAPPEWCSCVCEHCHAEVRHPRRTEC